MLLNSISEFVVIFESCMRNVGCVRAVFFGCGGWLRLWMAFNGDTIEIDFGLKVKSF